MSFERSLIFPYASPKGIKDIAYIPSTPSVEGCQNAVMQLISVWENGTLCFFRKVEGTVALDKSWNDGYWMKIPRYLEIINREAQRMQGKA